MTNLPSVRSVIERLAVAPAPGISTSKVGDSLFDSLKGYIAEFNNDAQEFRNSVYRLLDLIDEVLKLAKKS